MSARPIRGRRECFPEQLPTEGWYAPLPLLNRVPERIEVTIPCDLSPPVQAGERVTVLATARRPHASDALEVEHARNELRITAGTRRVAIVPWPDHCPLRFVLADGELMRAGVAVPLRLDTLDHMPIVTGLFTGLDLHRGNRPHIVVSTRPYATSPSGRQWLAFFLAAVCAVAGLLLAARYGSSSRRVARSSRGLRAGLRSLQLVDLVVVGVLTIWWVVAPTLYDDGWIWSEHDAFDEVGGMDFYFEVWGVQVPMGIWLEWLRNGVLGVTRDLVYLRIPTLLALIAGWALSRWCLARSLPARPRSPLSGRWPRRS